ncbi:hypothetical protein L0Z72_12755 [candidate division KSB1 bacterium]|nr:hypothetical protein [candidate division KSB1 bacterium]
MKRKIALIMVAISMFLILPGLSFGGAKPGRFAEQKAQRLTQAQHRTQLQFFLNTGIYQPSLKQFNDAIKQFNKTMMTVGYVGAVDQNYPYKVVIGNYPETGYQGTYNELKGEQWLGGGVSYFLMPNLEFALSVSSFKTSAVSSLSATFWEKKYYPEVSGWKTAAWRIDESIRIRPLLFSALYYINLLRKDSFISLYGGGGVGFYFSTLKNTIHGDYGDPQSFTTTYNYQLTNNFQANTNPLGFHGMAGLSLGWNFIALNFDVSYHYAKGSIDEWNNSTLMQYYVYGMAKPLMDILNVKEIDLGGLLFRGGVNVSF